MNVVFAFILTVCVSLLLFKDPNAALGGMLDGVSSAIAMSVGLVAVYAVWLSVLNVMEKVGLNRAIGKALKPLTKRLFPSENDEIRETISLNMSANLLGMGGAATPLGIKAINGMAKDSEKTNDSIALFIVINCTSIQLIPTTIIGLRAAAGSVNASDIILPSLIATTVSTLVGVGLCFAVRKIKKVIRRRKR